MVRRTAEVAIGDVHVAQQKKRKSKISAILLIHHSIPVGRPAMAERPYVCCDR